MYSHNATYIALAVFLILFCDTTSSECTQHGPCTCSLSDGSLYNLTGLTDEKSLNASKSNWTIYFHPCRDVKIDIGTGACANGVSLCLYDSSTNVTKNLGTVNETRMKLSDGNYTFPIFEISHNNVTSVINIVCSTESRTYFKIDSPIDNSSKEYHFILSSPYGCKIPHKELPKGLSGGSILVILFFTFAGIYFIGGIMALKILRGATGWEMLPNHEFWCDLPALVRDGVVFTFNCCRADSYERI